MPFIENISLADVRDGYHYDAGLAGVLIQIVDPDMDFPPPKFAFSEVHQFRFLDLEDAGPLAIQPDQAAAIVRVLEAALARGSNVIVHCHAVRDEQAVRNPDSDAGKKAGGAFFEQGRRGHVVSEHFPGKLTDLNEITRRVQAQNSSMKTTRDVHDGLLVYQKKPCADGGKPLIVQVGLPGAHARQGHVDGQGIAEILEGFFEVAHRKTVLAHQHVNIEPISRLGARSADDSLHPEDVFDGRHNRLRVPGVSRKELTDAGLGRKKGHLHAVGRQEVALVIEEIEPGIQEILDILDAIGGRQTVMLGEKIEAQRLYRGAEAKLAVAQRANKKQRVKAIHAQIANRRKDFLHKLSTRLVKENGAIFVGNVNAAGLAKTNMAKSVLDAGWSSFRAMLQYKCDHAAVWFEEVNERYTTQTCSDCGALPDSRPKGIAGLGIREWTCSECGSVHDRDTNAARNILARGHARLAVGIPVL